MINILKNDLYRVLCQKSKIILVLILTSASILLAVYFTSKSVIKGNIAIVTPNKDFNISSEYIHFEVVKSIPLKSDLIMNKYDAYIIDRGSGKYDVITFKDSAFKKMLLELISMKNPADFKPDKSNVRGVGTNILGFLLMFILLQGILMMYLFAEDKEQGQITRIAISPISFVKYLLAHCLFTFSYIFIPTIIILFAIKVICGINIGFTLLQYFFLLAVICAFATAFSLLLNTLASKSDTANMTGSAMVMLTTMLSGSFYSFDKGNPLLETVIKILPQKAFLTFAQGFEKEQQLHSILPQISYVIILTLALFVFSVYKNNKDYISNNH